MTCPLTKSLAQSLLFVVGELGRMMDCAAICTDFQTIKKTHLTLHHILELASSLKGKGMFNIIIVKNK